MLLQHRCPNIRKKYPQRLISISLQCILTLMRSNIHFCELCETVIFIIPFFNPVKEKKENLFERFVSALCTLSNRSFLRN